MPKKASSEEISKTGMTDFLIVHDVGQGAWFWNKVWGSATAPEEHPPRLFTPRYASQFYLLNLPGHGGDEEGDTNEVRLDECIQAITRTVERRGMRDLVLVGHGIGAMIALQAATQLPTPPKRLALVSGALPEKNRSPLTCFPSAVRKHFSARMNLGKLWGGDVKLPRSAITRYLCNEMEPKEITRALGFFGPLPTRLMETRVSLQLSDIPCPVSYVVLDQNRLLPPTVQLSMARLIPSVDIRHLNSCHQVSLHLPAEMGELLLSLAT